MYLFICLYTCDCVNDRVCVCAHARACMCTCVQRSAEGIRGQQRALGILIYHSPPMPSRQDLSLKPEAHIFCDLGDPPVSAPCRAGTSTVYRKCNLLHGGWDPNSNFHDVEASILSPQVLIPAPTLCISICPPSTLCGVNNIPAFPRVDYFTPSCWC